MIKIDRINIKRLSEITKINLKEDVPRYIEDISLLLGVIPTKLDHLDIDIEPVEEMISAPNLNEVSEIALEDLGAQEGRYFVSRRSVS